MSDFYGKTFGQYPHHRELTIVCELQGEQDLTQVLLGCKQVIQWQKIWSEIGNKCHSVHYGFGFPKESKGLGLLMATESRSVYERKGSGHHLTGHDEISALRWKCQL